MKVTLLNCTPNAIQTIVNAARVCHKSEDKSDTVNNEVGPKDCILLKRCLELGHESILEHVSFTFSLKLSRVAQTQLVRHRLSSFSIESQRYVKPSEFFVPKAIYENSTAYNIYLDIVQNSINGFQELCNLVPNEDARYCLPMAMEGDIVYTANLRSIRNAIKERTCIKAQKEIRDCFFEIKKIIHSLSPIFTYNVEKYWNCPIACRKCISGGNK